MAASAPESEQTNALPPEEAQEPWLPTQEKIPATLQGTKPADAPAGAPDRD